jgi:hypothetical protein
MGRARMRLSRPVVGELKDLVQRTGAVRQHLAALMDE